MAFGARPWAGVVMRRLAKGPARRVRIHRDASSILTRGRTLYATWTREHVLLESSPYLRAMLCSMRRKRNPPEPFKPTGNSTWLVVRNAHSEVLESTKLEPHADLHSALTAARAARTSSGWQCEAIGQRCRLFFCTRNGVRHLVSIEGREPPPVGKRW